MPFSSASASLTFSSCSWVSSLAFSAPLASSNCFLSLGDGLVDEFFLALGLLDGLLDFLLGPLLLPDLLPDRPLLLAGLLLQLQDGHAPFDLFEPGVQVFLLDAGVLVDLAVPVDQGVGVLDLLDELALIAGLQPREDRIDLAVERAEDELQRVVFLPSVGIAAGRGRPVRLHELGPLPGELQPDPGVVEPELLGQFVQDVGRRDDVDALVFFDSVLEGLRRRLVIPELALGLDTPPRRSPRPGGPPSA